MTPAVNADDYRLGTIEGFFGRSWSWEARHAHADFLAAQGFNAHVHAPKGDALLRKRWQDAYPAEELAQLSALAAKYRKLGLEFGIGLSPFELYLQFDAAHEALLVAKLEQLNQVGADTLCILFDDMHGNLEGLAERQVAIMDCVRRHSTARRFVLCPTYYSSDPRLAALFGSPPEHYLAELGARLAPDIDIFWTGPEVISSDYPAAHLLEVADQLRRRPLLWDNYPVNDARRLTNFLHLEPFERDTQVLREHCSGHLCNPMNQCRLSQIPLHTLARLYHESHPPHDRLLEAACNALLPTGLAEALASDAYAFHYEGLSSFTPERCAGLLQRYGTYLPQPAAQEVVDWLKGVYAFDPACLT